MEGDEPIAISVREKLDTVHTPTRNVIDAFIAQLKKVDPDFFEGCYLTGSITQQDFHPSKSDIDFVVLCKLLPGEEIQGHIAKAHKSIAKRFARIALNGWYITNSCLVFPLVTNPPALLYEKGKLRHQPFGISPVTLHELNTSSICVFGTPANELTIKASNRDVIDFLFRNINSYWANWVDSHRIWTTDKLLILLFPRFTEWLILGTARQYYTLKTGLIASKTKAGHYALQHLPAEYHEIIREAIRIRNEDPRGFTIKNSYSLRPSFERYNKTIECARFIIRQFNTDYKKFFSDV